MIFRSIFLALRIFSAIIYSEADDGAPGRAESDGVERLRGGMSWVFSGVRLFRCDKKKAKFVFRLAFFFGAVIMKHMKTTSKKAQKTKTAADLAYEQLDREMSEADKAYWAHAAKMGWL